MRLGNVIFKKRGGIALLTPDEPAKLNALSTGIRQGISEGLAKIDADDEIRAAILTGASEKAFCAGADISGFSFEPVARFAARHLMGKDRQDAFARDRSPSRDIRPIEQGSGLRL